MDKQVLGYGENLIVDFMEELFFVKMQDSDNALDATAFWSILRYPLESQLNWFSIESNFISVDLDLSLLF